jgi:hypothetical protein
MYLKSNTIEILSLCLAPFFPNKSYFFGLANRKTIISIEIAMNQKAKRTLAQSDKILLFYSFKCPYCNEVNVSSKEYKKEVVLCSNSGCRRIVIIDNFKDIA